MMRYPLALTHPHFLLGFRQFPFPMTRPNWGWGHVPLVASLLTVANELASRSQHTGIRASTNGVFLYAGFKCVQALGRIIVRGPYPPSNAIIYMHLQL